MAISFFIEFEGRARLAADAVAELGEPFTQVPGASAVELYTPDAADDPLLDDGAPPPLVAQLRFPSLAQARQGAAGLGAALDEVTMLAGAVRPCALDIVENHLSPEAGEDNPLAASAAIAYLVHYRRPAEDEAAFISYYLAHHPAIMAQLPEIRRLEIYTPVALPGAPSLPSGETMLICDVSFDSAAALTHALQSDVRLRLREDFHTFPPFTVPVTHFATRRSVLLP